MGVDAPLFEVKPDPDQAGGLLFTFSRNLAADDVVLEIESSTDLRNWTTTQSSMIESVNQGNGTTFETWAVAPSPESPGKLYVRVKAIQR